jgi:CubicO group peptidase (beta-lactamase class C family)
MTLDVPTFEEFVGPLRSDGMPAAIDAPLSQLPVGDFAVLAWIDQIQQQYTTSAVMQARLTAGWNTLSPRDVYAHLCGDADTPPQPQSAARHISMDAVRRLIDAEIDGGLQTGVQLSMTFGGQVFDFVAGDNGSGSAMTVNTRVPWTCSSKPLGALAFAVSWEAGALDLDTPVADVLPDFTGGGKEAVRVRHLLTHTTGMSDPVTDLDPSAATVSNPKDINELIWAVICATPTRVLPGTAMNYSPVSNWFVLDRMLNAINGGRPGDSYRSVLDRLGLTATLGRDWGLPAEQGVSVIASADQQAGLEAMMLASSLPLPGTSVWGSMRELRVVGDVLANVIHSDTPLIEAASIETIKATHWPAWPQRTICNREFPYGLGVMTQSSIFGQRCSTATFGHAGGNTSTLMVDPLYDLVIAVYWNGRLDDVKTFARRYALVRAIYEDLRLPHRPIPAPHGCAAPS